MKISKIIIKNKVSHFEIEKIYFLTFWIKSPTQLNPLREMIVVFVGKFQLSTITCVFF